MMTNPIHQLEAVG